MVAGWANMVVLLAAGAAVGILAVLTTLLAPAAYRDAPQDWREGEPLLKGMRRRSEAQSRAFDDAPRTFRLLGYAQVLVIVVVVLAIWLSPVSMGWWFVPGLVAGGAFASAALAVGRRTPPGDAERAPAAPAAPEE